MRAATAALLVAAAMLVGLRLGRPLHYSDGAQQHDGRDLAHASMVQWGSPEPWCELPGPVAGRIAEAPDGRLVYGRLGASGTSDLVVFDPSRPLLPPEPLFALNTTANELSPCFAADGRFLFASNRDGGRGGYDLYEVPSWRGSAPAVRPIEACNTALDESDPAWAPDGSLLVFVRSDRRIDDGDDGVLWRWTVGGELDPEPLFAPGKPGARPVDRDPVFAADGASLWFVRKSSARALQVLRTSRLGAEFAAPLPLGGPEQRLALRSPLPRALGRELALCEAAPQAKELVLVHRVLAHELVPWWPGQHPLELLLWSVLAISLLVLLLLHYGRRWATLDLVAQCLLLSLLLHGLLFLWLMGVQIAGSVLPGDDAADGFEVTIVAAAPSGGAVGAGDTGVAAEVQRSIAERALVAELPGSAAVRSTPGAAVAPTAAERPDHAPTPNDEHAAAAPMALQDQAAPAALREGRETEVAPQTQVLPAMAAQLRNDAAGLAEAAPLQAGNAIEVSVPAAAALPIAPREVRVPAPPVAAAGRSLPVAAIATAGIPAAPELRDAAKPGPNQPASGALAEGPATPTAPAPTPALASAVVEAAGEPLQAARVLEADSSAAAVAAAPAPAPVASLPRVAPTVRPVPSQHRTVPSPAAGTPPRAGARTAPPPTLRDAAADSPAAAAALAAAPRPEPSAPTPTPRLQPVPASPGTMTAPAPVAATRAGHSPAGGSAATVAPPSGALVRATGTSLAAPSAKAAAPRASSSVAVVRPSPVLREPVAANMPSAVDGPAAPGSATPRPRQLAALSLAPNPLPIGAPERSPWFSAMAPEAPLSPPATQLPRVTAGEHAPATSEPLLLASPYSNRFGPAKAEALERFGGSDDTERAVKNGLAYLARIQNRDGSWGDRTDYDTKYGFVYVGKTALCVLAFLGAGHTPTSKTEHSGVVTAALQHLLALQEEDSGAFGRSSCYGHGIATYALAECYGLTKDQALRRPLERALQWILDHQGPRRDRRNRGGWGYFSPGLRAEDDYARVSVSAWMIMALESARLSGIELPTEVMPAAREYLELAYDQPNGWFRYNHKPSRVQSAWPTLPASTPAAAFCLLLLGVGKDDAKVASAVDYTVERRPQRYRRYRDDDFVLKGQGNVYFWYYATLCCFLQGGEAWQQWNERLSVVLPAAQAKDGSFPPIDPYAEEAGDTDDDRSYTTAMCVLCLEVYYRYFTPLLLGR